MSEPSERARHVETLTDGLLHWWLHDDRLDFRSDAYAVGPEAGRVLIDPLPLLPDAREQLGRVAAICLTGGFHQRSAWRFRRETGAPVFAPAGAAGLEEQPDVTFADGEELPGGLRAVHAPGPTDPHFLFRHDGPSGEGVLFCADLLMEGPEGRLVFVPDEHQDDPGRTRRSARRALELRFRILCPAHAEPRLEGGLRAVREALEADARRDGPQGPN